MTIAIASGKGGTGKTWLATNLAALFSQSRPVLLVDMDVEEPNDHIFIAGDTVSTLDARRMIPVWEQNQCIFCGECSVHCNFNAIIQLHQTIAIFDQLCHGCFACAELCPTNALTMRPHQIGKITETVKDNLRLIEGCLNPGEEQPVPLIHQLHQMATLNHGRYPVHLYDCPPGTSCPVVEATKQADYVILVTEPTPFGLNDIHLAVKTMRLLGKEFGVVINRDGIGDNQVETYCLREKIKILGRIPYHRQIAETSYRGELMFNHPVIAKKLQNIIDAIPGKS
ncbi:MAG: P-loop NTPase [Bacteroidales bacterium]